MKVKMLVLITALAFLTASVATAAGPVAAPQGDARWVIGAATADSVAAFDRGSGPQDGSGMKARKGQKQEGSGRASGDRVRKGDGSCGEQGAQQTRKGNRNGGGKGKGQGTSGQ